MHFYRSLNHGFDSCALELESVPETVPASQTQSMSEFGIDLDLVSDKKKPAVLVTSGYKSYGKQKVLQDFSMTIMESTM
jgi:hypothetical protein